jgi:hypothetical protein
MYVTISFDEWLDENRTVTARDEIKALAAIPWGQPTEPWIGELPYTLQQFPRDRFICGPVSVLWLQSVSARDEFERLVQQREDK